MTVMTDVQTVAIGATTANILAGKIEEFLPGNSMVQLAITSSLPSLFVSFIIGNRVIVDDQEISNAAVFPIEPDHIISATMGVGGERLSLRFRNANAAANVVRTKLNVAAV